MRNPNTNAFGQNFPIGTINQVWNKGAVIPGYSPQIWRYDPCGKLINYSDYGNTNSQYGWEVDHKFPISKGGTDNLDNLQPLQWENNRKKSDTYPWYCS